MYFRIIVYFDFIYIERIFKMKKVLFHVIVMMMVFLYGNLFSQDNSNVKRLKRSESFLGIHFDFHAGNDCKEIGKNVDREMVEYIIDKVHPDYVQCDSKGHPGQSSYLTKVGNRAPGFVGDPLKIWREVTAERGVALYVHHSGVWDDKSCEVHPEWACINEKGEKSKRKISVFGPYVDELLIPQIEELAVDYGVDGVWIDGECWAVERDYSEKALQAFHEKTGITSVPRSPDDPYWFEFNQFCRDGFRDYVRHYVTELHKSVPNLQIASNWAFTSLMPEPVSIDVDFISGDYSAQNSFNSARFEGRVMVHQGKPWDLMAWSFTWRDGLYSTKPLRQLEQEASVVLALGGGFQAYFPQKRDGSIRKWQMNLMGDVAKFCRARQEFCFKSKPVPQVGLILSTNAFYRINKGLFAGGNELPISIKGVLQCLLDGQNVTDVVMEHHLQERADDFPLLIYPEWDYIDPDFKMCCWNTLKKGVNCW